MQLVLNLYCNESAQIRLEYVNKSTDKIQVKQIINSKIMF